MTAAELLHEVEAAGITVVADGTQLRIRPRSQLAPQLVAKLRAHKTELLDLLAAGGSAPPSAPRADDSVEEPESSRVPTFDEVATMQLDEFARAGLVVRVAARRLGCDVLLVSDDVPEDELGDRGLTVYRAAELRKLAILKPSPRNLRLLHDVKAIFNGTVGSIGDP